MSLDGRPHVDKLKQGASFTAWRRQRHPFHGCSLAWGEYCLRLREITSSSPVHDSTPSEQDPRLYREQKFRYPIASWGRKVKRAGERAVGEFVPNAQLSPHACLPRWQWKSRGRVSIDMVTKSQDRPEKVWILGSRESAHEGMCWQLEWWFAIE
jgi:hypothetical protein